MLNMESKTQDFARNQLSKSTALFVWVEPSGRFAQIRLNLSAMRSACLEARLDAGQAGSRANRGARVLGQTDRRPPGRDWHRRWVDRAGSRANRRARGLACARVFRIEDLPRYGVGLNRCYL